jgi:hypothetical protein
MKILAFAFTRFVITVAEEILEQQGDPDGLSFKDRLDEREVEIRLPNDRETRPLVEALEENPVLIERAYDFLVNRCRRMRRAIRECANEMAAAEMIVRRRVQHLSHLGNALQGQARASRFVGVNRRRLHEGLEALLSAASSQSADLDSLVRRCNNVLQRTCRDLESGVGQQAILFDLRGFVAEEEETRLRGGLLYDNYQNRAAGRLAVNGAYVGTTLALGVPAAIVDPTFITIGVTVVALAKTIAVIAQDVYKYWRDIETAFQSLFEDVSSLMKAFKDVPPEKLQWNTTIAVFLDNILSIPLTCNFQTCVVNCAEVEAKLGHLSNLSHDLSALIRPAMRQVADAERQVQKYLLEKGELLEQLVKPRTGWTTPLEYETKCQLVIKYKRLVQGLMGRSARLNRLLFEVEEANRKLDAVGPAMPKLKRGLEALAEKNGPIFDAIQSLIPFMNAALSFGESADAGFNLTWDWNSFVSNVFFIGKYEMYSESKIGS